MINDEKPVKLVSGSLATFSDVRQGSIARKMQERLEAAPVSRTKGQISIRLPVHVDEAVNALCKRYPNHAKSQVIADLVELAVEEVVNAGLLK